MTDIWYTDSNGKDTSKLSEAVRVFFVDEEVGTGDAVPEDFTNLPETISGKPFTVKSMKAIGYID